VTSSSANRRQASVEFGPFGRSTTPGGESRSGGNTSPLINLLKRDPTVVRWHRDAADLDPPPRLGRPGVERGLQVDVLEGRQLPGDHGLCFAGLSEHLPDQGGDLVALTALGCMHPGQQGTERRRELPGLGLRGPTRPALRHAATHLLRESAW
jgi:hypothetical protein